MEQLSVTVNEAQTLREEKRLMVNSHKEQLKQFKRLHAGVGGIISEFAKLTIEIKSPADEELLDTPPPKAPKRKRKPVFESSPEPSPQKKGKRSETEDEAGSELIEYKQCLLKLDNEVAGPRPRHAGGTCFFFETRPYNSNKQQHINAYHKSLKGKEVPSWMDTKYGSTEKIAALQKKLDLQRKYYQRL